ncbi:MAG: hypothetical protein DRJ64_01980 [Thermoprotei archaeon]|nr:MAG: hypothetical protein DRJ64_01980 [Thermoprotei archaeon]
MKNKIKIFHNIFYIFFIIFIIIYLFYVVSLFLIVYSRICFKIWLSTYHFKRSLRKYMRKKEAEKIAKIYARYLKSLFDKVNPFMFLKY